MNELVESLNDSLAGNNRRSFIGLFVSVILYIAGGMTYLLPVLAIMMIIDYIVGITAAAITGEKWNAKTAVNGLFKKVSYLLFVIFAQLLDTVVIGLHTTGILNVENFRYFGLIVNVYLIGTEGMSIMKNLHDCGVPLPKPFTHFFDFITQVGEKDKRKE